MIWTLQVAVVLPEGADPDEIPSLARLEEFVRGKVTESETVRIDRFTVRPGAVNTFLVATLGMHALQGDGTCFCGWAPVDGLSHAEHVADVFEESTRAHAIA
jgi:hypothetical protein